MMLLEKKRDFIISSWNLYNRVVHEHPRTNNPVEYSQFKLEEKKSRARKKLKKHCPTFFWSSKKKSSFLPFRIL